MSRGLLVLLLAQVAGAADATLRFLDGTTEVVALHSFDEEGLLAGPAAERRRIPWEKIEPRSAFDARKALIPPNDAAARRDLVEFARARKLFPEALEEIEVLLALGGIDAAGFEKRTEELRAEEQEYLCSRIDALLASGESPGACLEAIRALAARYPDHQRNAKYASRIEELEKAVPPKEEKAGPVQTQDLGPIRKAIADLEGRKAKAVAKAEALRKEAAPAIEKAQISRIKKTLLLPAGAERYYREARDCLRAMARADRNSAVASKADLQKEYEALGAKLIDSYLVVARALLRERNYKGTIECVRKILLLDPIQEEALDMIEEIKRNRIHFRSSETGGAVPEPRRVDD
jgi:hypothetical protein